MALVHDYLKDFGGAESVLETLSDIFPDAPIFTTLYHPRSLGPHRQRLEAKWSSRIRQSFFRFFPFAHKLISPLRVLSPLAFWFFDFRAFDLIITSATGAYFPNSLRKGTAKLLCYCHTPPRYLYGLATGRDLTKQRLIWFCARIANHFLRLLDFHWAQNVDQFVANSRTTALRIQKFYRRDALVINPPVELPKRVPLLVKGGARGGFEEFYLTGGRLAWAKRYDIAVQACNQLQVPLKVFGRDFAGIESELKKIAGPTIEFLGEVTQEEKARLFQSAKAYIFCSDNEDFGIVSVEAQGHGCPVVGYNTGGITETVVDGRTGVLFDQLTPSSLSAAIKKFATLKIDSKDCVAHAQQFSKDNFVSKINHLVTNVR